MSTESAPSYRALLIPADSTKPAAEITVSDLDEVEALLGDWPAAARYDYGTVLFVGDSSMIRGLDRNQRVTDYIRTQSTAARQGRMATVPPEYGLYGDVIALGERDGELASISGSMQRKLLMSMEQTQHHGYRL